MTGIFLLDWAIQAVSLFNVVLLTWLGLTVLLNAERRTGGILLASGGLLMGAAFFICHSAILGHDPNVVTSGQDFWWYLGWVPVVLLPLLWYLVMLWYNGFWESRQAAEPPDRRLYQRQRFWMAFPLLLGVTLIVLLFANHLLPSFTALAQSRAASAPAIRYEFPLVLVYPLYVLLSMGLSLDALLHPGPSRRWLGETARRRARPWLLTASVLLFIVGLMVGWAMVWILSNLERGIFTTQVVTIIGSLDLVIAGLIGFAVFALGQAVVSYEIFTARTLPRNGLYQHWRRVLILAAGYSLLVSLSLTVQLRPIYSLLLTTLLVTVFFAMLAWRSYAERERFMRNLRPFLAGSKVYSRILDASDKGTETDVSVAFQALCRDILETQQACLAPVGAMVPLAGPPIPFPGSGALPLPSLAGLAAEFRSPEEKGLPLDPQRHHGLIWAVPLWSERGLIGILLLGEKRAGGLYSQEEIETARLAGERLIDQKASAELARRLADLERQHLSHNQVMDQRTRRVLHDEILPLVHTALLHLTGNADPANQESVALLTQVHQQLSGLLRSMNATLSPDVGRLGLFGALRQVAERDLSGVFDRIEWQVDSGAEAQAKALPPLACEVLFFAAREALRNAARYGRADGGKPSEVIIWADCKEDLRLVIEDHGSGIEPGAAAASGPGSGQGLALHSTLMAVVGGSLSLESEPGRYTRVVLSLPPHA